MRPRATNGKARPTGWAHGGAASCQPEVAPTRPTLSLIATAALGAATPALAQVQITAGMYAGEGAEFLAFTNVDSFAYGDAVYPGPVRTQGAGDIGNPGPRATAVLEPDTRALLAGGQGLLGWGVDRR